MVEEKVQVGVVVLMACEYGVVMSRLDFSLRVGVVVAWEKNDSSIEVQGAVVVVVRIVVSRVGSSVVCEEGGSCVGGGRLLCGRRAGVCDPRDPSPTEPGESGVRCTHAIPRTPANGIFYKSRGNPTHLVQG